MARELFASHLPCDEGQLRRVYLRLALRYHPDKWPAEEQQAATELFQAIGSVYDELQRPFGKRLARRVKSPVAAAAELGDLDELRRLLQDRPASGWEEDENGTYPLMFAAKGGSVEAVRMLLGHGADLHVCNRLGWSVIAYAALSDHYELVHWLVARGARVTKHELILAAYTGSLPGLQALCELFGDAGSVAELRTDSSDKTGGAGKTLLHLVCEGMCHLKRDRPDAYKGSVDLLLRCGVPVDVVEPGQGRTCLHCFLGNDAWQEYGFEHTPAYLAVVEKLCQAGASPVLVNARGQSAFSLAEAYGLRRVEGILHKYAASTRWSLL